MEAMAELPLLDEEQHQKMEAALNKDLPAGAKAKKLNKKLSCCAGVAIVKASYPFFRAYELAEQLCGAAKKNSRQDDTSWLDFAILHGEKTPELAQLRRQQYKAALGDLHFGPYMVAKDYNEHDSLNALLALEERLNDEKKSSDFVEKALKSKEARSKIKKLRDILNGDLHAGNIILENATKLKFVLREETGKQEVTAKDFWQEKVVGGEKVQATRYIDAIEIMDFMPKDGE
jgi:hypothetical protein